MDKSVYLEQCRQIELAKGGGVEYAIQLIGDWAIYEIMIKFSKKTIEEKTFIVNFVISKERELFALPEPEKLEDLRDLMSDYYNDDKRDSKSYKQLSNLYEKSSRITPIMSDPVILVFVYYAVTLNPQIIVTNSLFMTRAVNYVTGNVFARDYERHPDGILQTWKLHVAKYLATGDPDCLKWHSGETPNKWRGLNEKFAVIIKLDLAK